MGWIALLVIGFASLSVIFAVQSLNGMRIIVEHEIPAAAGYLDDAKVAAAQMQQAVESLVDATTPPAESQRCDAPPSDETGFSPVSASINGVPLHGVTDVVVTHTTDAPQATAVAHLCFAPGCGTSVGRDGELCSVHATLVNTDTYSQFCELLILPPCERQKHTDALGRFFDLLAAELNAKIAKAELN